MTEAPNGRPDPAGPYPLLDLFSGYGGFSLAFEAVADANDPGCADRPGQHRGGEAPSGTGVGGPGGSSAFRTIGFSEIEPYGCALLAHRFPGVPNLGPVQSVTRDRVLRECGVLPVVVTGGFPCQPHSTAGKRLAGADDRDLWAECVRVLREFRPRVALFENVPGLLTSASASPDSESAPGLFFNRVLSDLAEIGFACAWETLSAADLGAITGEGPPHKRDRIWLVCVDERGLADRKREGLQGTAGDDRRVVQTGQREDAERYAGSGGGALFWPAARGLWPARPGEAQYEWEYPRTVTGETFPTLGEPVDGIAERVGGVAVQVQESQEGTMNRTHQLKALGNGIVPACAYPFAVAIRDYLDGLDSTA